MATTLPYGITRADLARAFNNDDKLIRAFEKVIRSVADSADISTSTAEATDALQDATVVTLSANTAFNNERRLAVASPLALQDEGVDGRIIVGFSFSFTVPVAHAFNMNLIADTNITMPPSGRLLASDITSATYANDAAAAAAGLSIGDAYRQPAGVVSWRQV